MYKDTVFSKPLSKQFEFDESVALVFDDMLERSIPFYKEALNLSISFADKFLAENDSVLDLGCSTATTLINLSKQSSKKLKLIGIDNSYAMIKQAQKKSAAYGVDIELICEDFLLYDFKKIKVILANYTLQFVRPREREKLIKKIYNALQEDGAFIFSEKIITNHKRLDKLCIDQYFEYKKSKGYSDFEIASKREALENILIPYSEQENKKMILENGFSFIETIFKWNNFATFIALKEVTA